MSRIDDAVRRILLAKLSIGIFEDPIADPAWVNVVGAQEHRDIAREAVRKSQVLLKNDANVIPINGDITSVLVAGHAAEDIGYQCGGWTIDWAGRRGNHTPGTTLHQSLRQRLPSKLEFAFNAEGNFGSSGTQADLGIVVIAEEPYVEGLGDQADLSLKPDQIALIDRMRAQVEKLVLIIYSGRPLVITEVVDKCDAIIASWLPGTEVHGIGDVLLGDYPFTGKTAYSWPRSMDQVPLRHLQSSAEPPLFPFGYGLTTQ
jgi:beta-glucosidase